MAVTSEAVAAIVEQWSVKPACGLSMKGGQANKEAVHDDAGQ
jgi:hypothetical protein